MRLQSTSVLIVAVLLVTASLACDTFSGGSAQNLQATANAILTQGASALGTGQATVNAVLTQGASALGTGQATVNAVLTQEASAIGTGQATVQAALTQGAAGATPEATAQTGATTSASTPAATSAATGGGPGDIPFINATNTILLTSANKVFYYTSADLATAVKFYKDQMPGSGWTFNAGTSVETPFNAALIFTKDTRTATVAMATIPAKKQTLVEIYIVSK